MTNDEIFPIGLQIMACKNKCQRKEPIDVIFRLYVTWTNVKNNIQGYLGGTIEIGERSHFYVFRVGYEKDYYMPEEMQDIINKVNGSLPRKLKVKSA